MSYVVDTARADPRRACGPGSSSSSSRRPIPARPTSSCAGSSRRPGSSCGEDFFLAFSPEREDPGNASFDTATIPKVVGGVDQPSPATWRRPLYDQVDRADRPGRRAPATAEATKLVENIFRAVNIALVNELKMVFDRMGIDIWEVLDAASTKPFGFMRFNPGPGWGGHCIPLDPFYLVVEGARVRRRRRSSSSSPARSTSRCRTTWSRSSQLALNERGKAVKGSRVLVLGPRLQEGHRRCPREPGLRDHRAAPAPRAPTSAYHDPHVPKAPRMRAWPDLPPLASRPLTRGAARGQDAVVIVTDHPRSTTSWSPGTRRSSSTRAASTASRCRTSSRHERARSPRGLRSPAAVSMRDAGIQRRRDARAVHRERARADVP